MIRMTKVVVACAVLAGCAVSPPPSEFHCADVSPGDAERKIAELNSGRGDLRSHYQELTSCLANAQVSGPGGLSAADYQRYSEEIRSRVPVRKDFFRVSEARQRFEEALRAHWHKTNLHRLESLLARVEVAKPGVLSLVELEDLAAEAHDLLDQISFVSDDDFAAYAERVAQVFEAARTQRIEQVVNPACQKEAVAAGLPSALAEEPIVIVYNSTMVASNFTHFVCGMATLNRTVQYLGERAPTRHGFRNQDGAILWLEKGDYSPLDIDAWEPIALTDNGIERRLSLEDAMAIMLAFQVN